MKLTNKERQLWLQKILSRRDNCKNLRAFVYNIFGVKLYSNQVKPLRDFLDPTIKKVLFSCARQGGKTEDIALACAIVPIFYDNIHMYIFAPKQEQAQISFERFSSLVHTNPYNIYAGSLAVDKSDRIKFSNKTEIRAVTASRNAEIEGLTCHIIVLDESQAISPFKVRESIYPMGGAVAGGGAKIIQCGVPGVRGTHFHKAFKNKYDPKVNPLGYVQHIYPWEQCPILNRDYVLARKAEDPISFATQYELSWEKSNIGMFLSEEDWARCIVHYELKDKDGQPLRGEFMGIDFAKLRDSTVITELRQDPDNLEHFYVVGWWELSGVDYASQIGFIKNLWHAGLKQIYADKSSVGEGPLDVLRQAGIPIEGFNFDIQHKDKLYKNLANFIQKGQIHWPAAVPRGFEKEYVHFKQQMMELEKEFKLSGLISVHHNLDDSLGRDDFPDSIALAIWAASHFISPSAYTI